MNSPASPATRTFFVLLLALATWSSGAARGGFALDDREVLFGNPTVAGSTTWSAVWTRDYWSHTPAGPAGHYRPLATASLRVDRGLWDESSAGYHATNLGLHLLVVACLARLLALLARDGYGRGPGGSAGWGLALFAAHPALADSVAWISGRTSMLSALGGLVGVLILESATRPRRSGWTRTMGAFAGAGAATILGALGKEDGVIFGLVAVLVARTRRRTLPAIVGVVAGVAALLALRELALGSAALGMPQAPLASEPVGERLAWGGAALVRALGALAAPFDVPPALGREGLAPLVGAPALLALCGLALALVGGGMLMWRTDDPGTRIVGASVALASAALLPWMQLVPIGELFAPRMLYLPLLLAVPAADAFARRALPRSPRARRSLAVLGVLAAVGLGWTAAATYASRGSYWRARLAHEPDSARAWNALGNARTEEDDADGAERAWRRAIELEPGYSRPWNNLGGALLAAGEVTAAEELFTEAVRVGPRNAVAWANLGNLRLRIREFAEAARAYERAVELSPGAVALWRGLARARRGVGDLVGARAAVARALAVDPRDPGSRSLAAELDAIEPVDRDAPLNGERERP